MDRFRSTIGPLGELLTMALRDESAARIAGDPALEAAAAARRRHLTRLLASLSSPAGAHRSTGDSA